MDQIHEKAMELLPWYVNDTLAEHQRHDLERHLRDCLVCRSALREEQRIQGLILDQEDIPLSATHGLNDLMGQIDRDPAPRGHWVLHPGFAAAAVIVLFVAIGFVLIPGQDLESVADQQPYSTLSDTPAGSNLIDVVFSERISETEIDVLIRELSGNIVSGPSDIGRVTLQLTEDAANSVDETVELLIADPRVHYAGRSFVAPSEAQAP